MRVFLDVKRDTVAEMISEYVQKANPSVVMRAVAEGLALEIGRLRETQPERTADISTLRVCILELEQLARMMSESEAT